MACVECPMLGSLSRSHDLVQDSDGDRIDCNWNGSVEDLAGIRWLLPVVFIRSGVNRSPTDLRTCHDSFHSAHALQTSAALAHSHIRRRRRGCTDEAAMRRLPSQRPGWTAKRTWLAEEVGVDNTPHVVCCVSDGPFPTEQRLERTWRSSNEVCSRCRKLTFPPIMCGI